MKSLLTSALLLAVLGAFPSAAAQTAGTVPSVADRVPIHFISEGSGGLPVVLIHCWSCDSSFWDATVAELARTRRVVALDLAGHGASGANRKAWTIASYAGDVKSVVEALNLKRVVLVGHSMGGVVMLEAAKMMPGRVAALVAVDTLQDLGESLSAEQQAQWMRGFETDFKATTEGLVRKIVPPDADPAVVDRIVAKMTSAPPAVAVPSMKSLLAYDARPAASRIRVPVVALNSALNPTNVDANRKLLPTFDLVLLEGVGHFPQLEKPAYFNTKLLEVLARIE